MKTVVTGGTGMVGSFLVEELLRRGASIRVPAWNGNHGFLKDTHGVEWMDGDLRDAAFCQKLLDGADRLFHLASRRKNVEVHRKLAGEIASDNIRMSLGLSQAVQSHSVFASGSAATSPIPVVFVSSATVPDPLDLALLSDGKSVDGYALGKAASEIVWMAASRQSGYPLLIVRPVGIYGPRDTFSPDGNVIPSLMIKAESSDVIDVWGSGKAERSFLYAEDVARALIILAEAGASGVQYLATPGVVTIQTLAELIRDLAAPGKELRFDASKPEGKLTLKFPAVPPFLKDFAWTPLAEGLQKTLAWWKTNR